MLIIGESGVGKTHYGAQLLKRLMNTNGRFRMNGAATNLEPFESALECLNDGRAAEHTPTTTYVDSEWPIVSDTNRAFNLVWPDYGGEQVKNMLADRRIPVEWRSRVIAAPAWLVMLRLSQLRVSDDLLSRPLATLTNDIEQQDSLQQPIHLSDQARMIELLQMLLFLRGEGVSESQTNPRICLLLSCWDELNQQGDPMSALCHHLPMLADFVSSNWASPLIMGLSALGRPLDKKLRDNDYVSQGPERFGYIVLADGSTSPDLTVPIAMLLQ